MDNRVFVIDRNEQPLMPCQPARARQLLKAGKAAVYRRYPFTIILKDREGGATQPVTLNIDPGSRTTGLALVAVFKRGQRVIWAAELTHRGEAVRASIYKRKTVRRARRSRHTRYRAPRFLNRARRAGWLPPSQRSRIDNVLTWVRRLQRCCPLSSLVQELVRFDTQALQNPEISGVAYQQGTLFGYEVREYLLEKWQRACVYCGKTNLPLQIEHLKPKSRGGSDRISNLTLACADCNQRKGTQTAAEFGYPQLQALSQQPLRDAAAVNTTRRYLYERLATVGLPLSDASGGRTKFNRAVQGYPKKHWIDAACVGEGGNDVFLDPTLQPLRITATGRGSRQMCRMDRFGFPRTSAKAVKRVHGFQTGDLVKAVVTSGKHRGTHVGRVAVRASGSFNLTTAHATLQGISYRVCRRIHQLDGYTYSFNQTEKPEKGDGRIPPQL